ncbi:MAG: T9SS type A sorting domain-containing protein [Flavobacteriales bacterium]|nr:T9SS type A sorting domain-containing protein [Flavobacteriales bacterium]
MKIIFSTLAILISSASILIAQGDIENVMVETYYITDGNDAADIDGDDPGGSLPAGSVTYRVFLDLVEGAKLISIYGDTNHVLLINSTAPFFNNTDRGEVFGFDIGANHLNKNTVALDSWLSFGAASDEHSGILKTEDPDSSIVGGMNNTGGSNEVAGGLLVNNDVLAGIPLIEKDGLIAWMDSSILDLVVAGDNPESVFNDETLSSIYESDSVTMLVPEGVQGPTSDNKILIAQLTTIGELTFEFNVTVMNPNGDIIKYVANDSILLEDENVSAFLKYPPTCGCNDPLYLEYDPAVSCSDGSCQTLIVLGCSDTLACNYDPDVNFNVQELCCILPDNCINLDPDLICPGFVGLENLSATDVDFIFYPNPFNDQLSIQFGDKAHQSVSVLIVDALGRIVHQENVETTSENQLVKLNTAHLAKGIFLLQLSGDQISERKFVVKN